MRSFLEFLRSMNEMFVYREENGKTVIAFRQWLWLVNYNSPKSESIAEKIAAAHPQGQKLLSQLREKDLNGVESWIQDYIPDALVGQWDAQQKVLWLNTGNQMGSSATTSPLVKKVVRELGARKVQYSDANDNTISRSRGKVTGSFNTVWYHGTTSKYMEGILRIGLKPDESGSNYADQDIHHDDAVFLAAKIDEAQYHGFHTAQKVGGHPVVLEIHNIPDPALLAPDYDVDNVASRNTYNSPPRKDYDAVFSVDSMKASKHAGLVAYRGRIPASRINSILIYSDYAKKWLRIRDLGKLKNVLARHGEDFWHKYGDGITPQNKRKYY